MYAYQKAVLAMLEEAFAAEGAAIEATVAALCAAICDKRALYIFGASHAGILAEELYYRAGGLMLINPIFGSEIMLNRAPVTTTSRMEQLEGYGTVLSGQAGGLSQGQAQLLALARIFIKPPKVLLLDEATSSIDAYTELKVQEAFNQLMAGRTSFVIAHRLATIRSADLIIVMNHGAIVEQGTHDQLMAKRQLYYQMQEEV